MSDLLIILSARTIKFCGARVGPLKPCLPRRGAPNALSDSRMRVSDPVATPYPPSRDAHQRRGQARPGVGYSAPSPSTPRMRSVRRRTFATAGPSRWCRRRSVRDLFRPFVQVQLTPEIFGRDCKVYRLGLLEEERGYANQVARTIK